jgi:hypothetical protein
VCRFCSDLVEEKSREAEIDHKFRCSQHFVGERWRLRYFCGESTRRRIPFKYHGVLPPQPISQRRPHSTASAAVMVMKYGFIAFPAICCGSPAAMKVGRVYGFTAAWDGYAFFRTSPHLISRAVAALRGGVEAIDYLPLPERRVAVDLVATFPLSGGCIRYQSSSAAA